MPDPHDPKKTLVGPASGATPPRDRAPSDRIGPYRLLGELGRGGQAVVYLAEDARLGRQVALKVLTVTEVQDRRMIERFRREAEITSRLEHPSICSVYELGEAGDVSYIAMQYVEGTPLSKRIQAARGQTMSGRTRIVTLPDAGVEAPQGRQGHSAKEHVRRVLLMGEQVARGLHAAHEEGIVHRDVKPGNVMITEAGDPVILDFGLARNVEDDAPGLTRTGLVIGTPAYMSPEQLQGRARDVDHRADIYALGVMLYECLTLYRPFEAPTYEALCQAILTHIHVDPRHLNKAVSRDLKVVLDTALEKDPSRRYKSAADFADDLRRVRANEPVHARPVGRAVRLGRWATRHPAMAVSLVAIFILLNVALAISWHFVDAVREENEIRKTNERHARALVLAGRAREKLQRDPMLGLLLGIEAQKVQQLPETLSVLQEALASVHEEKQLSHGENGVVSAEFFASGELIRTRTEKGEILLWEDGAILTRFGSSDPVVARDSSPDGERFAAASAGTLRIHEWGSERPVRVLIRHGGAISSIDYAPDGRSILVVVAGGARILGLDGEVQAELASVGPTRAAMFSPHGDRVLLVLAGGAAEVRMRDGEVVAKLSDEEHRIAFGTFTPAGDGVVTYSGRTARIWSLDGQRPVSLVGHRGGITSVDVSPDGRYVLTASQDGTAIVWSRQGLNLAWCKGHGSYVESAVFSPDGNRILTASRDTTARLYDLAGEELAVLRGHEDKVVGAAFSGDGKKVVTASKDGTARIWDVSFTDPLVIRNPREPSDAAGHQFYSAKFSPNEKMILTADRGQTATLWNLDGRIAHRLVGHQGIVAAASFNKEGDRIITSSADNKALLWDCSGDSAPRILRELTGHEDWVLAADFSPVDGRIVTASLDHTARLWTAEGEFQCELTGHTDTVRDASFSPDGRLVATASDDGSVRLWDARGEWIRPMWHSAGVNYVDFSSDGELLATACGDTKVYLWRVATGERVREFTGHQASVNSVVFSPGDKLIVSASRDETIRLWDARSGEAIWVILHGHQGTIWSAHFAPWRGDRIVSASQDGTVRVWMVDPDDLIARSQRRVTRRLTSEERSSYARWLEPASALPGR